MKRFISFSGERDGEAGAPPVANTTEIEMGAIAALERADSVLKTHNGDDGSGLLGMGKDIEVGSTAFNSLVIWVREALKSLRAGQVGPVVRYHSEVSGMWYHNRLSAGDIDCVEVDGLTYPLALYPPATTNSDTEQP